MANMFPTPFQKKVCWSGLTALAMLAIAVVLLITFGAVVWLLSALQPLLIPVAIAAILAYLLDPVVRFLGRRGISRTKSTLTVFAVFFLVVAGVLLSIVPAGYRQGAELIGNFPDYTRKAQILMSDSMDYIRQIAEEPFFQSAEGEDVDFVTGYLNDMAEEALRWLQEKVPDIAVAAGNFLHRSIGGFLGIFGFLLSMILVPVFLFVFLMEGPAIAARWSDYLPLRASPLKAEIVSLLTEINGYLIAYFRGQMLVSLIDGAITAMLLLLLGLDFAILIGLMVGILGMIPYIGVFISWIPAVLIAAAQFGDWTHPLIVTAIFLLVNNLDGYFIAPRIVGDSVGLHPFTVIVSVVAWSVILGGLLGALLAVPLTATLKVVGRRYFWDRIPGEPAPVNQTSPEPVSDSNISMEEKRPLGNSEQTE